MSSTAIAQNPPALPLSATVKPIAVSAAVPKKIWIDLENSPHVPFFKPIIEELENRGHSVILTARDCFQVCELADLFAMEYKRIGRHYGKHTLAKLAGLAIRVLQMTPMVLREKPDLALSHGSRSLFLLSSLLRIPTLTIFDYEHSKWPSLFKPTWVMVPEVMPDSAVVGIGRDHLLRYPGIKEDVYAPAFQPDPTLRRRLGLGESDLVITIRPPANEAHYHNPESELLLDAVFEFLGERPEAKAVLVPRTGKQGNELRRRWPQLFDSRQVFIPEHVVDGLDLIWASDLVISGGGTMNREAAALGVPVYSIFRGRIGAVDRYLEGAGRLTLIESAEEVRRKLQLTRRSRAAKPRVDQHDTLRTVVDNIVMALASR
ncbi:MAG TPA: DUF354 domain-containing protein [Terriglobales bacterium]|nr:DUF354 domain-containing protein [Terriglobales bacterium]